MSLAFGLYLSAIGASVVFVALLIIALICIGVRRIFKAKKPEKTKLRQVAALAAISQLMEDDALGLEGKVLSEGRSNWLAVARLEALGVVDRER